jgi:hypothetical protein
VLKVLVALSFFPFLRRLFPAFGFCFIRLLPVNAICEGLRLITKLSRFSLHRNSAAPEAKRPTMEMAMTGPVRFFLESC